MQNNVDSNSSYGLNKLIYIITCCGKGILLSSLQLTFLLLFFKSRHGQLLVISTYFSVSLFPIDSLTLTEYFNFLGQVNNSLIGP